MAFLLYNYLIHTYQFYLPCPIREITRFYCPGCGISRCILELMQFHFYEAFRYNPLVFILLPVIAFYFFYQIYLYITDKEDTIVRNIPNWVWYIVIAIVIVYGILRNVPSFSFLAPTSI